MKPFESIVGKGENAGNQHFLLFPQCFLLFPRQISIFESHFVLSSANALNSDKSKNLSFSTGLQAVKTMDFMDFHTQPPPPPPPPHPHNFWQFITIYINGERFMLQ